MSTTSLRETIQRHLPSALELLRQMVGINSFTTNREGVNKLGRCTADAFSGLGFQAEFVASSNPAYGDHLILSRKTNAGPGIALVSHLDTVFSPEEELRNSFEWRRQGDRIYGPGTIDIKGGTAMIFLVLSVLAERKPEVFAIPSWHVCLNSSEEEISSDFAPLCLERLGDRALAALVFEASGRVNRMPALVVSRKGRATFRVIVEGRAAHAGTQHGRGANAIVQIAEVTRRIAALTDYEKDLTFNVGAIEGGTVVNRVPHRASAEVEMRAFSREAYRAGLQGLLGLAGPGSVQSQDGHRCIVRIDLLSESPPWPVNPGTDWLFGIWKEGATAAGIQFERQARGGVSDGNYLWDKVATIDGLGPHGDNDHCSERNADGSKDQEYVEESSFLPMAMTNCLALERLIRDPKKPR